MIIMEVMNTPDVTCSVTVCMPASLLQRLDTAARHEGRTRSNYLARLLSEALPVVAVETCDSASSGRPTRRAPR